MNKFLFLLFFALPLFGETIKIKFDRKWHPKIEGLNHSQIRFITSKPMIYGSRNSDGSIDRHELGINFTPMAKHYGNMHRITEPTAKGALKAVESILAEYIGLESVDLLEGAGNFSLETLSWKVEKLFIKSNYSLTCKTIKKDNEGLPQETIIELYFKKN